MGLKLTENTIYFSLDHSATSKQHAQTATRTRFLTLKSDTRHCTVAEVARPVCPSMSHPAICPLVAPQFCCPSNSAAIYSHSASFPFE